MSEQSAESVRHDIATSEVLVRYWLMTGKLADAALALLEHDTEQTRGRLWHLAHQAQGHEWWCGVKIDPEQFDGSGSNFAPVILSGDDPPKITECAIAPTEQSDGEA